ncbi:hypothetical protein EV192_11458 [Actinocrispum wychmicini]|uniref:Uncharacterized protein n=1 Tax=Actinocrispum wychmicini TaxID=1213861 RepID=A0A4R2IXP3_9PSEU|nr:hypothetical protein EV192_11458 [Actinocrispum wychmicini]
MTKIHPPTSSNPNRSLSPSSSWCSQRSNIKYTGRQAWARTSAGRPTPVEHWITSAPRAHEPLIDERTFRRAQPSRSSQGGDHALPT